MQLQQLVNHFNSNFAQEHECDFQPFVLNQNTVKGIFGIACIGSEFTSVRSCADNWQLIAGYAAKTLITNNANRPAKAEKIKRLLDKTLNKPAHVPSVTTFDRLCRTVNLLNYLELSTCHNFLITEVNPHHILSLSYNHGAYFEEIIVYSGLKTQNVVISMTTTGIHPAHYPKLLQGLENYRECGYQIALNVGHLFSADKNIALIKELVPDYVIVSAPNERYAGLNLNSSVMTALRRLKELTASLGKQIILQDVEQPEQDWYAMQIGFDFVQGSYYENLPEVNKNQPITLFSNTDLLMQRSHKFYSSNFSSKSTR